MYCSCEMYLKKNKVLISAESTILILHEFHMKPIAPKFKFNIVETEGVPQIPKDGSDLAANEKEPLFQRKAKFHNKEGAMGIYH